MVLDDAHVFLLYIEKELKAAGLEVKTFDNATDALSIADEFRPQLVLIDLSITDMDALSAARKFREKFPEIIIIITSAQYLKSDERLKEILRAGADDFLVKPIDSHKLVAALRRIFNKKHIMSIDPVEIVGATVLTLLEKLNIKFAEPDKKELHHIFEVPIYHIGVDVCVTGTFTGRFIFDFETPVAQKIVTRWFHNLQITQSEELLCRGITEWVQETVRLAKEDFLNKGSECNPRLTTLLIGSNIRLKGYNISGKRISIKTEFGNIHITFLYTAHRSFAMSVEESE